MTLPLTKIFEASGETETENYVRDDRDLYPIYFSVPLTYRPAAKPIVEMMGKDGVPVLKYTMILFL